jgi:hypothetical protein
MMEGNRVEMIRPGDTTPVPAGTEGVVVDFSSENGWEIQWENGVNTFFPSERGDEIATHAQPGEYKCDFCGSSDVRWEHRAEDAQDVLVTVGGGRTEAIGQGSNGSWAACEVCHRLIDADKRDRLAYRAAREIAKLTPGVSPKLTLFAAKRAHEMYWRGAVGPGIPVKQ